MEDVSRIMMIYYIEKYSHFLIQILLIHYMYFETIYITAFLICYKLSFVTRKVIYLKHSIISCFQNLISIKHFMEFWFIFMWIVKFIRCILKSCNIFIFCLKWDLNRIHEFIYIVKTYDVYQVWQVLNTSSYYTGFCRFFFNRKQVVFNYHLLTVRII